MQRSVSDICQNHLEEKLINNAGIIKAALLIGEGATFCVERDNGMLGYMNAEVCVLHDVLFEPVG